MWFWITRRFRLWLLFAVGAPVAAWVMGVLGDVLERRGGETAVTRGLATARGWTQGQVRGPLGRRGRRGRGRSRGGSRGRSRGGSR